MAVLFPEGGADHFVGTAFWPMLLVCLGAARARRPDAPHGAVGRRDLRRRARGRVRVPQLARPERAAAAPSCSARRCSCSSPARGRRARALVVHRRRAALPAVAARRTRGRGGARRPVDRSRPSTPRCCASCTPTPSPASALEVPLTRNHWEATYLAQDYPLARGWHRQLDRKVNPLFYDTTQPLTAARYERWLRENAVRWVALPDRAARLLRQARAGAAARRAAVPQARLHVAELEHLGGARHRAARVRAGAADRRRRRRVRPRGHAPRRGARAPARHAVLDGGGRRRLRARRTTPRAGRSSTSSAPGLLRVRAKFSALGALRREPRCAVDPTGPPQRTSAVNPPVTEPLNLGTLGTSPCGRSPAASPPASSPGAGPTCFRQIVLFCGAYWLYRLVRGFTDGRAAEAFGHARDVIGLERGHGPVHRAHGARVGARAASGMIDVASWMYVNSHFTITTVTLAFIYLRRNSQLLLHPQHVHGRDGHRARALRGLPDRAAAVHARVGLLATRSRDFTGLTARGLVRRRALQPVRRGAVDARRVRADARRADGARWRAAGARRRSGCAYPVLVTFVVVATANHWWFDAFTGALVAAVAALAARRSSRAGGPAAWAWAPPAAAAAAHAGRLGSPRVHALPAARTRAPADGARVPDARRATG